MSYNIVAESYGGDVQVALISAKKNIGVDDLLEKVLLQVISCFPLF
jgi:translation initiation factor IF-2